MTEISEVQGGGKVGLKDVARKAKVSVAAASMALADHPGIGADTKRRIQQISAELGYKRRSRSTHLARMKSASAQKTALARVGFLIVGTSLHDTATSSMLQSLMRHCDSADIALQVASVDLHAGEPLASAPARAMTLAKEVDGLVLMGHIDANVLRSLEAAGVPHVTLGYTMTSIQDTLSNHVHAIANDDTAMGQMATDVLLAAGHRRIGFIAELVPYGLSHWRWRNGYVSSLVSAGLTVEPSLIHVSETRFDTGDAAAEAMLKNELSPTAYVIPDPRIASGFLSAMRSRGAEVPRESVVIGVDPAVVERYGVADFPLIQYDHAALVATAVGQLQQIYQNPSPCASTILVPFNYKNLPQPK